MSSTPRQPLWTGFLLLICMGGAWELLAQLWGSPFLPPPSRILGAWVRLLVDGELPMASLTTLARCFAGFALAATVAVPLGTAMGLSRVVYGLLEPLVECLRPIPSAAAIPVAILFLGIADGMKVAVVVFGCVWPILLNTIHGVQSIDAILVDTGRTLGLERGAFLRKIVLPAALPSIATGCRISLAIALILAITVEMIVGGPGLGYLILDFERSFRYADMYAGIFMLGLLGYGINWIFTRVDRRFLAWARIATDRFA